MWIPYDLQFEISKYLNNDMLVELLIKTEFIDTFKRYSKKYKLSLYGLRVTDYLMKFLNGAKELTLTNTKITDRSLKNLKKSNKVTLINNYHMNNNTNTNMIRIKSPTFSAQTCKQCKKASYICYNSDTLTCPVCTHGHATCEKYTSNANIFDHRFCGNPPLYCSNCKIIFRKGGIHYYDNPIDLDKNKTAQQRSLNNKKDKNTYYGEIVTSYYLDNIHYKGMPKFKTYNDFVDIILSNRLELEFKCMCNDTHTICPCSNTATPACVYNAISYIPSINIFNIFCFTILTLALLLFVFNKFS